MAGGARPDPASRGAAELCGALVALRAEVATEGDRILEDRWRSRIERKEYLPSAQNLAYYIALRRRDLRELQLELMPWGLSSLGRCEAQVLENLDAVIAILERLEGSMEGSIPAPNPDFYRGHELLQQHAAAALGPAPANREVRIMVTLPTAAATDAELVGALVEQGMDVARINCAHDDAEAWAAMAHHVRRAVVARGRPCLVCMDLCGPRARIAAVQAPTGLRLQVGDRILMRADRPREGQTGYHAQFQPSLPEIVMQVKPGDSVWVDEGKLGAAVERRDGDAAVLRVTRTKKKGGRLRVDKGLNLPDTELHLDPLTPKDLADLDAVAANADMVGHSFVQRPGDIDVLQQELAKRLDRLDSIALVAKIETKLAVRNLPELIVQGAGRQPLAVMIARGDLAVELGHLRLAEIQEELLWLCEAAHVPVIWATQVLDTFVHRGFSARAEITDAAMAERAECVMLNKGPFAVEAVALLDDLLGRMEDHQFKKSSRLRALRSW